MDRYWNGYENSANHWDDQVGWVTYPEDDPYNHPDAYDDDSDENDDLAEDDETADRCDGVWFGDHPGVTVYEGSIVTVEFASGEEMHFILGNGDSKSSHVGLTYVSRESPVGSAVLGARVGDEVDYYPPAGGRPKLLIRAVDNKHMNIQETAKVTRQSRHSKHIRTSSTQPKPTSGNQIARPREPEDLTPLTIWQAGALATIRNSPKHTFVTGPAGTGKSLVLRHLVRQDTHQIPVTAPTGIAAIQVGGETIHSFFSLPIGVIADEELPRLREEKANLLRAIDTVVVDEVSMVSADIIDAVDRRLRDVRRKPDMPFGGVRMVLFGDPYQLPPVPPRDSDARAYLSATYRSQWFFDAKVWRETTLRTIELAEAHRQQDPEFRRLLAAVRHGRPDDGDIERLNAVGSRSVPRTALTLATTNVTVDQINGTHLLELPGRAETFVAVIDGDFPAREYPTDRELTVKVGARIMLVRNDVESFPPRWANGTLGTIVKLDREAIHISIDEGPVQEVSRSVWDRFRYKYSHRDKRLTKELVGTFSQFPIRLAWALTIHKSQGSSLRSACVDLGSGAFAPGQTYVALSRLETLEGLYFSRPLRRSDVMVDHRVLEYLPPAETSESFDTHALEEDFHKVVGKARSMGASWEVIGGYFGISGESARHRFE